MKHASGSTARMSGFSLIEIMVTVGIIGIMSAVSIVSLSGLKSKQEVEGNMRRLAATIREAQNYALTGRSIITTTSVPPCKFQVIASGSTYTMRQSNANACAAFGGDIVSGLSNGVTFSANKEVRFLVPRAEPQDNNDKEVGGEAPGDPVLIDFTLTKGAVAGHVCVYPLGRIEENLTGC